MLSTEKEVPYRSPQLTVWGYLKQFYLICHETILNIPVIFSGVHSFTGKTVCESQWKF